MRRGRKKGKGCLSAFVVLLLLAGGAGVGVYLYLGTLVGRSVEAVSSRVTGVPVTASSVKVLPWSGEGTIRDLAVGCPDGYRAATSLHAARVDFEVDLRSLLEGEGPVVIRRVEVSGVTLEREVGPRGNNLDEVLEHVSSVADSEADNPTEGVRLVRVGRFALRGITVAPAGGQGGPGHQVGDAVVEGLGDEGITVYELARLVAGQLEAELERADVGEPSVEEQAVEQGAREAGEKARQSLGVGDYPD